MFSLTCVLSLVLATSARPQQTNPATQESADSHVSMGYEALKQDRYEQAANEFRAALAIDPALVLRARFPLAVALFQDNKPEEARREFEAVRQATGDHPNVMYYLGRLEVDARNFQAAIHDLNLAAKEPPFPDTAYYLGFAYFKNGELAEAAKWLEDAVKLNPRDARISYQLGLVYRKQGREEEARKTLALSESVRQRNNDESKVRLECARKLDSGPLEEARPICDQLYDDNNADKLTELGSLYGQHRQPEAALKPLQRAAELAPHSPQTQYNLALTYFQLNQSDRARSALETALKRWPDLFQLNALYGSVLLKSGQLKEGHEALRHAHQLNAGDPATEQLLYLSTLDLARQNRAAKQYSDSLNYLREAAALRPLEPEPHRSMAEIYQLMGNTQLGAAEQAEANRLAASQNTLPLRPN
ncbi:MAG TPA: tetratricopeptide repeat protein [Terriglobales bacterium]|nr:tetratricopeptide repeat protein [Terriglobales bacterium]